MLIPVDFADLADQYPALPALNPAIKRFMSHTQGTPCCVQMSWTLNFNGVILPSTTTRPRPASRLDILPSEFPAAVPNPQRTYFFHLAVDEILNFLRSQFGDSPDYAKHPSSPHSGSTRLKAAIIPPILNRQGILVFSNNRLGAHVELWDGSDIVQTKVMNQVWCFSQPSIFFWECKQDC